ncbi:MAG: hypothetical protein K2L94_05175, partial [Alphaproteobacteria bacterium]|nr:hypothetical protein [Alphaproteobacteria bacterium]
MTYRNSMAEYQDITEKRRAFAIGCANGNLAWDAAGREIPLRQLKLDDVEFVAGAWRVQSKFTEPIFEIRGRRFVLRERLPRVERNRFEFYHAAMVAENCYGLFAGLPSAVVAKYHTTDGTYWGYGPTIE